jgi:DNA primase
MRPLPSSEDARDQIRSRLNLVDVVQQHVRLRKQGREYLGLCPFHQEKTPSFQVNEQKQSWYCFGCQKGGDLFGFVEEIEKTDFVGALRILAEQAGVDLPERSGPAQQRSQLRKRLLDLNRLAARYYEHVLWSLPAGEPGRLLMERREVDEETARRFGLGYAPGGGNLTAFLRKRGHSMPDAAEAGLVRGGRDYFQQRLVVPIRDERGQVLAFTGRTVVDGEPRKYVNTPETPAYSKGRVLFALDLARSAIQERGHAVLMEGQFDVIVGHRFGVPNAIASSGTALTGDQLTLLRRFTDEVVLMFDNDPAGRAAAAKAIELAQAGVRVAEIEGDAKDPDEFLRTGGSWDAVLHAAQPGWEWVLRQEIAGLNSQQPADREVGVRKIKAVLDRIKDDAQKETYAERAGQLFGMRAELLLSPARRPAAGPPSAGFAAPGHGNKVRNSVGYLLSALVVRPEALDRVLGILDPDDLGDADRATFRRLVTALERGGSDALGHDLDGFTPEEQQLIRRAWADPPPRVDDEAVDDVVRTIQRQARKRQRHAVIERLREAERRGDLGQAEALEAQLKPRPERT